MLRNTIKLVTSDELRGKTKPKFESRPAWSRRRLWERYNEQFESCGIPGEVDTLHVPEEILQAAIYESRVVGIDEVALGKQAGSIFGAEHFAYEPLRDHFYDILYLIKTLTL